MALVGIIALNRERAERVRRALALPARDCALISTPDSARGCMLATVVWVDPFRVSDEVLDAVTPAITSETIHLTVGKPW